MIREIAIALFDSHGGIEEGDVIVCRAPSNGIGKKEGDRWLWFRADISADLAAILAGEYATRDAVTRKIEILHSKRRFKIPLEKIKAIDPDFDIDDARDQKSVYQPYLPLGEDMLFSDPNPDTFALEDLEIVWDKSTGAYI
jgi:hypothetical protein